MEKLKQLLMSDSLEKLKQKLMAIRLLLIKNKEELEGASGLMILISVAFSSGMGFILATVMALGGLLRLASELGEEKPKILETLAVTNVLLLPLVGIIMGVILKYMLALASLALILISFVRKNNESKERY